MTLLHKPESYKLHSKRQPAGIHNLRLCQGPCIALFLLHLGVQFSGARGFRILSSLQVGSDAVLKPHGSEKAEEWQRQSKALASTLRTKSGIEIGPSKVLLHVLPVEGLVRQLDNSIEKQFAQKSLPHPLQVPTENSVYFVNGLKRLLKMQQLIDCLWHTHV